jgi:4-amino-4-deoxy-L-arabinose transferase-like glycosyltransferase
MELSSYFRINTAKTGQFERTLIIAEEGASVSYLEGCTAPKRDENQLHAAVVELVALAATLLLVLMVGAGQALVGRGGAVAGAVVLATSYAFFTLSRSAHLDVLLTLLVSAALFAAWRSFAGQGGLGARLVFWAAAGFAVLVKGPVGLILPLLVVVVDRLWAGAPRDLARLGPWWGLPLALAPSLAWLGGVSAWRPGYDPAAVVDRHVLSRFSGGLHHARPAWYHLANFFAEMAPWSFLVPAAVIAAWRWRAWTAAGAGGEDTAAGTAAPGWAPRRFLLAWIAVILAFFSISSEKRGLYILPLLPAAALLVGALWDGLLPRRSGPPSPRRWLAAGLLPPTAILLACGLLPWLLARRPAAEVTPALVSSVRVLAAVGVVGGALLLAAWIRWRWAAAPVVLAGATTGLLLVFALLVEPAADPLKSARFLGQRLAAIVQPGDRVGMLDWRAAYLYYSGVAMDELGSPEEVRLWLEAPGRKVLLLSAEQQELLGLSPARLAASDGVGHRQMRILVVGEPPLAGSEGTTATP